MKVEIRWSDFEFKLRDIVELVEEHAKSAHLDGDKQILVIEEPDEFLLEELENRSVKYAEV